jgi:cephalosporin hydroxylase
MLIDRMYAQARGSPSDIWEHLELLSRLASLCDHVTEFGMRYGASTTAMLFGRPRAVVSYDIAPCGGIEALTAAANEAGVAFVFHQADVLGVDIDETDLLFIDTLHTFDQLSAELARHAPCARRYIALHDTSTFGDRGEGDGGDPYGPSVVGLWPAVASFLRANAEWRLQSYHTHNHGLTVLERSRPKGGARSRPRVKAR